MKLSELKRGMRITFRQKDVKVIDAIKDGKVYLMGGAVVRLTEDLKNEMNDAFDVVKVDDLDKRGNYYEIFTRDESKFLIKPKVISLGPGKSLVRNTRTGYWETSTGIVTDGYEKEFTKDELKKYGIDEKHFDLIQVIDLYC